MTVRTVVVVVVTLVLTACGDGSFAVADAPMEDAAGDALVEAPSDGASAVDATDATAETLADTTPSVTDTRMPDPDIGKPCTELSARGFGGHCYFPLPPMTWSEAKAACKAKGAYLVVITSQAEHTFVQTFGGIADRFIGLERAMGSPLLKESFAWVSGEQNLIDKWALTEPNGSGLCGEIRPDGLWGDAPCDSIFPALCERD